MRDFIITHTTRTGGLMVRHTRSGKMIFVPKRDTAAFLNSYNGLSPQTWTIVSETWKSSQDPVLVFERTQKPIIL